MRSRAAETAATTARQVGERRATETGATATSARERAGAAGTRAAATAEEAATKAYLALNPLDEGSVNPPASIRNVGSVKKQLAKNKRLLKKAKSERVGHSFDANNEQFDAFVDTSTSRIELESAIAGLQPLIKTEGHTTIGKNKTLRLRKRVNRLKKRLTGVIDGRYTASMTAGLKRGATSPATKKRPRKGAAKRAKDRAQRRRTEPAATTAPAATSAPVRSGPANPLPGFSQYII